MLSFQVSKHSGGGWLCNAGRWGRGAVPMGLPSLCLQWGMQAGSPARSPVL